MASTTAPTAGMWRRGRSGRADGHRGVGLGVWGWPICAIDAPGAVGADGAPERRVRPHGWRAALLRVRDPVSGALRSVQSAVRSPPRASTSRAVPALLGGHIFLHVLPTVLLAPCWASGAEPPRVVRVVTGHRACPAVCSEAL